MKSAIQSLIFTLLVVICPHIYAQITLTPTEARPEDEVTLTFDASQGNKELQGATSIYIHHGIVTDKIDGTAWKYVKGNWGKDDGIGKMTKVTGTSDKWEIKFSPDLRTYFGAGGESIFRISCVFRNPDGSKKGTIPAGQYSWGTVTSNGDIYINLKVDNYIKLNKPTLSNYLINAGDKIDIEGEASSAATDLKIWIDEGQGFVQKAQASGVKLIQYSYVPTSAVTAKIKVTGTVNGAALESSKDITVTLKKPNIIAPLPNGVKQGVNYHQDSTKATLVLLAPKKQLVHVVGDVNNWQVKDEYQMKQTPDGEYFWLELSNLIPGKSYVYQYWIDGFIKVADPYTEQVADPWNDKFIESSVFPNIPSYTRENYGIASVLKTDQAKYTWAPSETTFKRPDVNHLTIYELHLRDFFAAHSFDALRDTLKYIKRLGINAIELMPINEFEGNDSWGYNPSFFFAVDKYYGTKDALKRLIETAHQEGLAVIMDIVLNHSYGQSPLLQMYYDPVVDKPAIDNPWYNREYVGQYQWGYDFNHESPYMQRFVDDVNAFWLNEFHFDGFRFDFTKGFTNSAPGGSVDNYDASRINILKRMANKLKGVDPSAYIILEHWAPSNEEQILGAEGMKMWRNKSYDWVPATIGKNSGSFGNTNARTHVSLFNSHDERRLAEHCLTEGLNATGYNIKDKSVMLERVKMAAAMFFLQPGPKMMWQFDELGYDIDINFNGRIGRKPLVWGPGSLGYYADPERQNVYKVYQGIFDIRNRVTPQKLASSPSKHKLDGNTRRLVYDTDDIDIVVVSNFDIINATIVPEFTKAGKWYNYFSGDSMTVSSTTAPMSLKPGEWHIFTSRKMSNGQPDVVKVYENPVTITPQIFNTDTEITIRFDAKKADPKNSFGLIGADKVYMHSGVILPSSTNNQWENIRTYPDNGAMTFVGNDIWEIKIKPRTYFGVNNGDDILQIGMWFRDETNTKLGYGFRGNAIYADVLSTKPIITVDPTSFKGDTEVTITFDAAQGNRELVGATKVYMHSGVGVVNTTNPAASAWNKVKGNWGQDDGVGLMTKIGTDKWQIKLKPKDYYGLTPAEVPYWIAAVFRSADGSKKGTTQAANYDFGFVASNQDYFIQNKIIVGTEEIVDGEINIYPNPTSSTLTVSGLSALTEVKIINTSGQIVKSVLVNNLDVIDVSMLNTGVYHALFVSDNKYISTKRFLITD